VEVELREVPSRICAGTPFTYTLLDNGGRMLIATRERAGSVVSVECMYNGCVCTMSR